MPCCLRCCDRSTSSPHQGGGQGSESADVWIITDPSAILFICSSLMGKRWFFPIREAYSSAGWLPVSSLRYSWAVGRSDPFERNRAGDAWSLMGKATSSTPLP
jgi:hypothetical protein